MDEQPPARERTVSPNGRLLFVLVLVFLLGAFAVVTRFGGTDQPAERRVELGRLESVLGAMTSAPLPLAEVPGIVVVRGPADPLATPRWGEATGSLPLDRRESLFALSLDDPADGATLAWCASSQRFEHPDGERAYGRDGRLLDGTGPRGMDRRAISVGAAGQVVVDPGRWVAGVPVDAADAQTRPRGQPCVTTDS